MDESSNNETIPVVDLSCNDEKLIAEKLVSSFRQIGFVTLINHGINNIDEVFHESKSFFRLPIETKLKYKYQSHESNRGYIPIGSESHTITSPDKKETFDIGNENEIDFHTPWPTELDTFREKLLQYFTNMNELNLRIMKLLAIGLNVSDMNYFINRCNEQHCNLRLLHYPSITRSSNNNNNNDNSIIQRGATHTDFGTITLLAQDMVGGLRVQKLDGTWIHVQPVKDSVIVNVGDMLQRMTNDTLIANPHQVVNIPNSQQKDIIPERYSIAFFCNANKNVTLDPLEEVFGPAKYKPINAMEYLTQRLQDTIQSEQ